MDVGCASRRVFESLPEQAGVAAGVQDGSERGLAGKAARVGNGAGSG